MAAHYFQGPDPDFDVFQASLGEYVYRQLKSHPPESVIQVNGLTGEQHSVQEVLAVGLQAASGLRARGVGPGDLVVIAGDYSHTYFAVFLGAILQNATLFPINNSYKQREMEHLLVGMRPKIVFVDYEALHYMKAALERTGASAEIVLLNAAPEPTKYVGAEEILCEPDNYEVPPVKDPAEDAAAYMHSSGTAGLPKVIAWPHRSIIYHVAIWTTTQVIKENYVNLQASKNSWIVGYLVTLQSYVFGFKRVYVHPNKPENLAKAIDKHRTNWVITPPFNIQEILLLPNFDTYDLTSMKCIVTVGCPPVKNLHKLFYDKWKNKEVILGQIYGSTELGYYIDICSGAPYESAGKIGRGVICKVVDPVTGQQLGPNETGELRFKSVCPLIKCYVGKPKETKDAFDAEGFFLTGDVARVTADNLIYLTGRLKDYIVTKTGRVTPWLVEDYIMDMGGIKECAVVGILQEDGCYAVAAAVVLMAHSPVTEEKLDEYMRENFSDTYHLTGGIKFVTILPRNVNYKLDREKVLELFTCQT